MEKRKNVLVVFLPAAFLLVFLLWGLLKPDADISESERRKLAQKPELTAASVWSGSFMSEFESYTLDQFPLRERFRQLRALTATGLLGQKDSHGIYLAGGYAAKLDYPLNTDSVQHALSRFQKVYDSYLAGTNVKIYTAVIPDKGQYLAQEHGYPALDFSALQTAVEQGMPYASYIDLTPALGLDCYYKTDLHWRQEALLPAAKLLADSMGVTLTGSYETVVSDTPFCGVYSGQSALPMQPDTLSYLTNKTLQACTVYDYETGTEGPVYALDELKGENPYAVFLSGSRALLTVTNPSAEGGRELVIFRDSFGSSLAPLLIESYAKITLVDIRYLPPERLGSWLSFENQDVLFLYSASVLNNSETIK